MNGLEKVLLMIETAHQLFHANFSEESTPDDPTMLMALTHRDLFLIGIALPALEILYPECFREASLTLQRKLIECTREQRPDWTRGGRDEDES